MSRSKSSLPTRSNACSARPRSGTRAPIGLERMTESAVGVAERGYRVADRSGVSAREEPLEPTAVEDPEAFKPNPWSEAAL